MILSFVINAVKGYEIEKTGKNNSDTMLNA